MERDGVEWPTLGLIIACYGLWLAATAGAEMIGLPLAVAATAVAITLHSSLQHEIIHGHPFRDQALNDLTVRPAIGFVIPLDRYRDTHLQHHYDPALTDPYDDPESAYLEPAVWARQPGWIRMLLRANNTLSGRMLLGPAIGLWLFWRDEMRAARRGDRRVRRTWARHALDIAPPLAWLWLAGTMPGPAYLLAAYLGLSVLKLRVFLEHRAHAEARGRSAIVEDRGPLALLFLNNNLHAVHHAHPRVPWYALPALYRARRDDFLRRNFGYRFDSYWEVCRRYWARAKEPVAHPLYGNSGPPPAPEPAVLRVEPEAPIRSRQPRPVRPQPGA